MKHETAAKHIVYIARQDSAAQAAVRVENILEKMEFAIRRQANKAAEKAVPV